MTKNKEINKPVRIPHKLTVGQIIVYVILFLQAFIILVPFWIMFVTSIKSPAEIQSTPFTWWPTQGIDWSGYQSAFNFEITDQVGNILLGFFNTLWMVVPTLLVGLIASGLGAYAYAKLEFKGKNVLFGLTLFMMLIPGTTIMIPKYFMYQTIGWIGTPLPMIIPGLFGSAGTIFFLCQYMRGVPNELFEAAEVDGLNKFKSFWLIMLPVAIPAFTAQFVLGFIGGYNDYLGPYLYLEGNATLNTLQLVLRSVGGGNKGSGELFQKMMAYACISIVPLVTMYFALQDKIINGISVSALSK